MTPIEYLTFGLLIFAAVQVGLQARTEQVRRNERRSEQDEVLDRAFHYAWAEHFRLESLADVMQRSDLVELALLDLIGPDDVTPRDTARLLDALASSGREAGVLGGVLLGATVVRRSVGVLVGSVKAFARQAPPGLSDAQQLAWIRQHHDDDLTRWEDSTRELVKELSLLAWDAVEHSPRARIERELRFSDNLHSRMAAAVVHGIVQRGKCGE